MHAIAGETSTQTWAEVLRLLRQIESEEERSHGIWTSDPRPVERLFTGLRHPGRTIREALQLETYGFSNDPGQYLSYYVLALNASPVLSELQTWLASAYAVEWDAGVELVDSLAEPDAAVADGSDLAAEMAAHGVTDEARDQFDFVLGQMSPDMRQQFEDFAGAVGTPFLLDDDYLLSGTEYGQGDP